MLGWGEVTGVPGEHADHSEQGSDINVHLRTPVTKGKSEIRQNTEGTSHVKHCFISGVAVWEHLKAEVMVQVKREKELNVRSFSGGLYTCRKH